ncbi:MAG: response regulator [Candidatus Lokiarchaeota archaeon]|nr:response regulator [Candidatus Lokiarchaeota archaeon]
MNREKAYKIVISLLFGFIGFITNFFPINFQFDTLIASFLFGLLFPMVIAQAWGWRYGLLSSTLGLGCQSMWFYWTSGWGKVISIPFFTLWVVWHGYWADKRNKIKQSKAIMNFYVIEIIFRIINIVVLFTLFRFMFRFNPPPWDPTETQTTVDISYVIFISIKELFNAYLILVLTDVLLHLKTMRTILKLEKLDGQISTSFIIELSMLFGAVYWIFASIVDFFLYYKEGSFLDYLALNIPSYSLMVRLIIIFLCLAFGLIVSRAIRRTYKSETLMQKARAELEKSQTILESALEQINTGIVITDTKTQRIILFNSAAAKILGVNREKILNTEIFKDHDPRWQLKDSKNHEMSVAETPLFDAMFNNKTIHNMEIHLKNPNVPDCWLLVSSSPIKDKSGAVAAGFVLFTDITTRKRHDEQMMKDLKMESLGILAGGIAHDFNNLLTSVLGNISLLKMNIKHDSKDFSTVLEAEMATLRAKDLARQLLTFAKGGKPAKKITNIGELVRKSANFSLSGSSVAVNYVFPTDLWYVNIDPGQISQVIQNLVINAIQSIQSEEGKITITGTNLRIKGKNEQNLEKGDYISISITDTGCGIPSDHIDELFDPYFTTKENGTGLGLTVCHSIIKKHQGAIKVDSCVGDGTTFTFYLPALPNSQPDIISEKEKLIEGKGKVLILDDETAVSRVLSIMLKRLKFSPHITTNGNETIEVYRKALENNEPFDFCILDLTIKGGMGGLETMEKLLEIDPSVKAIVSSGYAKEEILNNYKEHQFKGKLAKPYTIQDLSNILHQLTEEETNEK